MDDRSATGYDVVSVTPRRRRRMRLRSRSDAPPHTPCSMRYSSAYSRHSARTGQSSHTCSRAIDAEAVGREELAGVDAAALCIAHPRELGRRWVEVRFERTVAGERFHSYAFQRWIRTDGSRSSPFAHVAGIISRSVSSQTPRNPNWLHAVFVVILPGGRAEEPAMDDDAAPPEDAGPSDVVDDAAPPTIRPRWSGIAGDDTRGA